MICARQGARILALQLQGSMLKMLNFRTSVLGLDRSVFFQVQIKLKKSMKGYRKV
jgi:hypothetical protein